MDELYTEVACRHDVPELIALSVSLLPHMTYLHDPDGWRTFYRFGAGQHDRDNLLIVARNEPDAPILGFCWADAAMYHDHGIEEPWWCINAVAVTSEVGRRGIGRALVTLIKQQAAEAGVVTLYGICYPESVAFWTRQGFGVSSRGGALIADRPVRHVRRRQVTIAPLRDAQGDHMFVASLPSAVGDEAARLFIQPG